ncbi:MAG: acyl-CoA thioesterase [Trichocoleus desertorum ATA4-8-CV12]|jgi:1,4-dihydroxy-2-naphthoyl-CoA hydrolase|nr:acyl-CoA thioesterase [Trichocoleus desertorum ATA4-8-CV12]
MPFIYPRTIRFQDTDAAGVVYFANVLAMCHEAYEASLVASGINLKEFFSNAAIAIPIVHAEVDFFRPMFCGDQELVHLTPTLISNQEFRIDYQVFADGLSDRPLSQANTRHVCINPAIRKRENLPEMMRQWLKQWSDSEAN